MRTTDISKGTANMTTQVKRTALALFTAGLLPFSALAQSHDAPAGHEAMDHGSMQGEMAPADARDPDAYSGGFKRNEGQFALDPRHRLHMSDEHMFASLRMDKFEYVRAKGEE